MQPSLVHGLLSFVLTGLWNTPETGSQPSNEQGLLSSIATGVFHYPVNPDDQNACTADACNTLIGAITNTTINTNDNNVCTTDGCNSITGIFHNQINSSDGNPCTIDGCDPLNGAYHIPVDVNDDNVCTTDGCNTSTGIISHNPINTNDGNVCTTDGCNSLTGPFHNPVNADDGNPCTNDGCDVISGVYHNPVNINDGNACTIDACNSITGVITHTNASPTITATAGTISCYGGTTCVTVTATGGMPPYVGTGQICGYNAGGYSFDVFDAKGCFASSPIITIDEPSKLIVSATSNPAGCATNNGTATATPSGGTPGYSYLWTPGGQTTNPATGLAPGSYSVKITDANGCTESISVVVGSSGSSPAIPGTISGPAGACKGQSGVVYCITPVPGATAYVWSLPSGASAVGSSTGECITLKFNSYYNGGFICVRATNPCGSSLNNCKNIIKITSAPVTPATLSGPTTLCPLASGNYTSSSVVNATSYIWSTTGGLIIVSGQGTTSAVIKAPAGFSSGNVKVKASNCKGNSSNKSVLVTKDLTCKNTSSNVRTRKTIVESEALSALNAYPNPTSGKLRITFNSDRTAKYSLKVVNIIGSLIIDDSISAFEGYNMKEINLENTAKGIYFISVQTEGAEAKTMRIIVE